MSFEKILYKLRDAWRGDIRRSLEGLPGYYWGEVTGPGEVLLDAVAPGSAPVPVDDLVGALMGDRVLLVHVDGAFSVVGAVDRPRVPATSTTRQVYATDASGVQTTLPYHPNPQNNALVQRQGLDVLVPQTPAYINSAASRRHVELNGVPRFATVAARDTAFPSPVNGQVCYVTGVGYYVRDGGVWRTVLGDTGWQRLTPASGYTNATDTTEAQYRYKGGVVYLRGTLTKDSGTIGANETVGAVPAQFAPERYTGFTLVTLTPANGIRGRVNTAGQIGTQTGTTLGSTITLDGAFWIL